jgi:hypothetical protein
MSTRRARVASAGLIAATLVALVLAAGPWFANDGQDRVAPRFVSTAASKRAAREDVERRIAAVALPPWAKSVSPRSPLTNPHLRGRYPFYGFGALHPLWDTAFASFRGGPRAAIRWFLDHPPPGSKLYNHVAGPTRQNRWYRCLWFELPGGRPFFGERNLTLCAVKTRGRTSVRVDAESIWLEGRSPYERIPHGSRYMEVSLSEGGRNRRSSLVADPAQIAPVVGLLNSLPVLQRDTCAPAVEEPSPSAPRIEVLFRSSPSGWPIARIAGELAPEGNCPPLRFWLRGRHERPLAEGWLVVQALHEPIKRLRRALER